MSRPFQPTAADLVRTYVATIQIQLGPTVLFPDGVCQFFSLPNLSVVDNFSSGRPTDQPTK